MLLSNGAFLMNFKKRLLFINLYIYIIYILGEHNHIFDFAKVDLKSPSDRALWIR